jgi:hypothetical protein
MKKLSPDYRRIYNDIITKKFPEKKELCQKILDKKELSTMDIIRLNSILFDRSNKHNSKHRSYDVITILEILEYQKKHNYNNTQLSIYFRLSRNTVARWRKLFS